MFKCIAFNYTIILNGYSLINGYIVALVSVILAFIHKRCH